MRLLYVVNARIPTEKAHGLQIVKTIEALENTGIDVTLFIPRRKNYIKTNIVDFYNIRNGIKHVIRVFDIVRPALRLSEYIYFPLQRLWFGLVAFTYALFWKGIIYSRDITVSFLLSLFGKQVIYEDHQPKKRWHWLYAFFLRTIPRKVVVARHLIAEYQAIGISKESYIYVPNGVDIAEFNRVSTDKTLWNREFGIPEGRPVALYVGHFYQWKGLYTVLDAARDVNGAIVFIGGTKEDFDAVAQYIKERAVANVFLHPFVPHHEIIRYIKSADVLLLPNTADEERSQKYTTPIKLFEYMASGVPIVASNITSFTPYLVHQDNALLCESDNPKDLARQINAILSDTELGRKIAGRAQEMASSYDWKKRAGKIVDFIT